MRILQIAPLWESVPPPAYGGTEAVVSVLTEGLVAAGHEVVLWASGDSETSAELRSIYPHSLRTSHEIESGTPYDLVHAATAVADADGFDIIHNHAGEPVMALAGLTRVPMLTTMHCLTTRDTSFVWDHYEGYFNTISEAQVQIVPPAARPRHIGVAYNAIDVASFPFSRDKEDYLLFLNRISPEKGTHLAIEVARKAGRKLVIAGKVDRADVRYYEDIVKPLIDGKDVVYVGEADRHMKRDLFARAACVLMPICWEEPFGLVTIEAMACGTPVIAFRRGSMPELIKDGETGFLVNSVQEMVEAVPQVERIEAERCRRHVEENFDVHHLVAAYERLYAKVLAAASYLAGDQPGSQPLTRGQTKSGGQLALVS